MVQSTGNTEALQCATQNLLQANSCSSEHSKLCFVQHEILRAAQNNLPLAFGSGAIYSKVVNREKSITNS
jgi:hypothetical protein